MAGLLVESQARDVADRSTLQGFLSKYVSSRYDASQSSMSDYDRFITPNFNYGPDALSYQKDAAEHDPSTIIDDKSVLDATTQVSDSTAFTPAKGDPSISTKNFDPPKIVNRVEKQAAQKLLANSNSNTISLSAIGIGLLSLATMMGARLWRGLQPATTLASSSGLGADMPMNTMSALGDNVMEMKVSGSISSHKVNSGRVGWVQQSSQHQGIQAFSAILARSSSTSQTTAMAHARLIFSRHGESEWNGANIFTGWVDVDLSEKGVGEAENAGV